MLRLGHRIRGPRQARRRDYRERLLPAIEQAAANREIRIVIVIPEFEGASGTFPSQTELTQWPWLPTSGSDRHRPEAARIALQLRSDRELLSEVGE